MADPSVEQAERLLHLWGALALRHVALGGACACGAGGVSLRLEDFELDIVDYLQDAATRCDDAVVAGWARECQAHEPDPRPVRRLLEDLVECRVPHAVADWLLPKLERTLRSFAELHGPAGSDLA